MERDKRGRFVKGHKVPKEIRKKLSIKLKGRKLTKEHIEKIRKNHRRYQSPATRKKISIIQKGRKKSKEHIKSLGVEKRK